MDETRRYQAMYFVFYASFSGFVVFRNVLLEEMGMTGVQMGIVGGLWVAGGVLAQPVWGLIADYTHSPRRILIIASILSAIAILSYPLGNALPRGSFIVVAAGTVAFSATRAPVVPISNSLVLRQGYDYGFVRSFGSIAFGATVLVTGFALAYVATSAVVYLYILGMVVFIWFVIRLPRVEDTVFKGDLGTKAVGLIRQPRFLAILVAAFLMGIVSTSGGAFFSVYMRAVGLGDGLTGIAWALKTITEAVVFITIGRTAFSYGSIVALGGLSFLVGNLLLGTAPALTPVLVANVGLGAGLALLYFSLVNLAHACAPSGLHSTAQTLLTSVGVGAGGALGQTLAGWLVDVVGVQEMYLYLAAIAVLLVFVGVAVRSTLGSRDAMSTAT